MTRTRPNVTLLLATLAYIEDHPDEWDQSVYRCGSAACFAGHAVILAGREWASDDEEAFGFDGLRPVPSDRPEERYRDTTGVFWAARRALGLSTGEARVLFDITNDGIALRRIIRDIIAEEVEP